MHKYRAAARNAAWYEAEGDPPTYNPFRKIHKRLRPVGSDPEDGHPLTPFLSEGNALDDSHKQRRSQILQPTHAATMPSSSGSPTDKLPVDQELPMTDARDMAIGHENDNSFGHENEKDIGLEHEHEKGVSQDSEESSPPISDSTAVGSTDSQIDGQGTTKRRKFAFMGNLGKSGTEKEGKKEAKRRGRSESWLKRDKQTFTAVGQFKATILNSWINVLLIFVPIGIAVNFANVPPIGVFVINFIAIIPLAAMLSYATEEIAIRTGETIGGLLNATFGNAVELIVSILALVKGEVDIVQESLIGSILSNLLLVMGMCFFFGGLNRVEQHFNVTVAQTASSLLALAVGSLIIPAAFQAWADGSQTLKSENITELSRGTAILLLVVYACYLLFQLKTHASMYSTPSPKVEKRRQKPEEGSSVKNLAFMGGNLSATAGGSVGQEKPVREPEEESETPQLSKWVALFTLAASTALVAICAEFMVDSINAITASGTPSRTFVGLILLPIVGNAAEHATAVTVACKDKMDLAIGVAVGSSMQIALLVIPFTVVLSWIIGPKGTPAESMNLAFDGFQIAVLFVAILLVNYLIQDGKSHWLEGVLLQILYMIIAIAAWFYPPDDPSTINSR